MINHYSQRKEVIGPAETAEVLVMRRMSSPTSRRQDRFRRRGTLVLPMVRRPGPRASLPYAFIVPRRGKKVRVRVRDRNDARVLRTELELLRLVRQQLSTAPPVENPLAFSAEDRRELRNIVYDAQSPLVDRAIAVLDAVFPRLRTEVFAPAVCAQAVRLAREASAIARESSSLRSGSSLAGRLTQALLLAEAELARVISRSPRLPAPAGPRARSLAYDPPASSPQVN